MTRPARSGPATDHPQPLVEIVRLPVTSERLDTLVSFLEGHAYFAQPELASSRVLVAGQGSEVVLVLDWKEPGAAKRALTSPVGVTLVEGLGELLSGPPAAVHYRELTW
jgi:hypothetical protein